MIPPSSLTTTLRVAEATKNSNTRTLSSMMRRWNQLAQERLKLIQCEKARPKAVDLCEVTKAISRDLQKGWNVFFAYDENLNIEGLAIANFSKSAIEIKQLATHPKNIPLFEGDTKVCKGVGTSLMALFACLALESNCAR